MVSTDNVFKLIVFNVGKPCWPKVSGAASSKEAAKDPDGNFKLVKMHSQILSLNHSQRFTDIAFSSFLSH